MPSIPNDPTLTDRWTNEVRRDELDLPQDERTGPGSWTDPFQKRLATVTQDIALLGRHAALHWIDVTGKALDSWPELDRVEVLLDHQQRLRLDSYTPRAESHRVDDSEPIPVRYPYVRMWENGVENTITDDYIDGFQAWAPVWNPLLEQEFCTAMVRIAQECPEGVGRDDLGRARRAVLGDVAVQLEGDRLRSVIDTAPQDDQAHDQPAPRRRM